MLGVLSFVFGLFKVLGNLVDAPFRKHYYFSFLLRACRTSSGNWARYELSSLVVWTADSLLSLASSSERGVSPRPQASLCSFTYANREELRRAFGSTWYYGLSPTSDSS